MYCMRRGFVDRLGDAFFVPALISRAGSVVMSYSSRVFVFTLVDDYQMLAESEAALETSQTLGGAAFRVFSECRAFLIQYGPTKLK